MCLADVCDYNVQHVPEEAQGQELDSVVHGKAKHQNKSIRLRIYDHLP